MLNLFPDQVMPELKQYSCANMLAKLKLGELSPGTLSVHQPVETIVVKLENHGLITCHGIGRTILEICYNQKISKVHLWHTPKANHAIKLQSV